MNQQNYFQLTPQFKEFTKNLKPTQKATYQQIFILKDPLDFNLLANPKPSKENKIQVQQQFQQQPEKQQQNTLKRSNKKLSKEQRIQEKYKSFDYDEAEQKIYKDQGKKKKNKNKDNDKEQQKPPKKEKKQNQRFSNIFSEYWADLQIQEAIQEKKAYEGIFLSNEKNSFLAKIKCENFKEYIFINSLRDQNRALHGQKVGFILFEDRKQQNNEKERRKQKNNKKKNEEWETESETTEDELEQVEQIEKRKRYVGRVVYIFNDEKQDQKVFVGLLQQQRNSQSFFVPNNPRYPRMIPIIGDKILKFAKENNLKDFYVKGVLQKWEKNQQNPVIVCDDIVGPIGDIEIECRALLEENLVVIDDFSNETKAYLAKQVDEESFIPDTERQKRLDLSNEIICTIDPEDARDLDDALSIKIIDDNTVEVGVHIADVSFFVKEGTPLDDDAQLRTTSVYLVHRVIPMLPRVLCDNLCSLNPNVERLAFSVFFQMDFQGNVIEQKEPIFKKSIINSCSKFSYETVQQIIDQKIQQYSQLPEKNKVRENIDGEEMLKRIQLLSKIGIERRKRRLEKGVLTIENNKKKFKLDPETLFPQSYSIEERKDANFVVEEFMLLANQLVAKKIVSKAIEVSVLRRHEFPQEKKQARFNEILAKIKMKKADFSNLHSIIDYIQEIQDNQNISQEKKIFLKKQLFYILEPAEYFVADQIPKELWKHFALNFDVYTHFTSPIRRYPDLIVHRVLEQVLEHEENAKDFVSRDSIINIMKDCNSKKIKAKRVSDGCQKIFLCLYLKKNPVTIQGILSTFGILNFNVFVPDYEIQQTIHFQDLNCVKSKKIEIIENQEKLLCITYKTKEMRKEQTIKLKTIIQFVKLIF